MGDVGFTTEERQELENYFGKTYMMEIFHRKEKQWRDTASPCYNEVVNFIKNLPTHTVESGVRGFISRSVEALSAKVGKHPRAVMEELVATEDPIALRTILAKMLHATA